MSLCQCALQPRVHPAAVCIIAKIHWWCTSIGASIGNIHRWFIHLAISTCNIHPLHSPATSVMPKNGHHQMFRVAYTMYVTLAKNCICMKICIFSMHFPHATSLPIYIQPHRTSNSSALERFLFWHHWKVFPIHRR